MRSGALVTHRFPLAEIGAAFAAHQTPSALKVAITLGPEGG